MLAYQTDLDPLEWLMAFAADDSVSRNLALPILGPRVGLGCLPLDLGLGQVGFADLLERYFPGIGVLLRGIDLQLDPDLKERSQTRQELAALRQDEVDELVGLLEDHRDPAADGNVSILVANACLGGDHLWRDLGFQNRQGLSDLMQSVYPGLTVKNDKDMKWKRFFYKQLCEMGGGYVCRAPSCDQCSAYQDCFGPEE